MVMYNPFKTCHITVNRACNIRCSWCYANSTNFLFDDDMTEETYNKIVDICKESKIRKIILIGGEPTVYNKIFDLLEKLAGFKVTVVTNGIALANYNLCKKYIEAGVSRFSVSIKAHNSDDYKKLTSYDGFNKVLKAINNLKKLGANFSVSYVVTENNVQNIISMMDIAKEFGAEAFFFSFVRNFNINGINDKEFIKNNNPFHLGKKFEEILPVIRSKKVNFSYALNDPLCVFDQHFVKENLHEFKSPCYVYNESSLTFDTKGNLIPCNTMYQIKVGKLFEDFNNLNELLEYRKSEKYTKVYRKLKGLPSEECKSCKLLKNCYGRCVCNWTNYSFTQLRYAINNNGDFV